MKNSKNKHRLRRRLAIKLRKSGNKRCKRYFWSNKRNYSNRLAKSVEVVIFELDPLQMKQQLEQDPWYNTLSEPGFLDFQFVVELPASVVYQERSFVLLDARSHVQTKILLGKWLRYAQFYHQAYFTFTKIGKPAQGVSPPEEQTLQAA